MNEIADSEELADLPKKTLDLFSLKFGRPARFVAAAPGRINLIGEHTDYNDGLVLPMAIDRYTVVAADRLDGGDVTRVYSAQFDQLQEIPLRGGDVSQLPMWSRYVCGVLDAFADEGFCPGPFEAVIDSTVPLGGGLSSSAALEVAVATIVEAMTGESIDLVRKALLCQRAEHRGAGVPCGIMDQFSSVLCEARHLMLLDCRSRETQMIPLSDPDIEILIINSNVKHELTGGEYAKRRQECQDAAKVLGVGSLRDATSESLQQHKAQLGPLLYRRSRHVVDENRRTAAAAEAIEAKQWDEVGRLMYESHASLRDDYEVSCTELDILVTAAKTLGDDRGMIGSRMTGGGFGGCTVSLVRSDASAEIASSICSTYREKTGIEATSFSTRPAVGARVLRGDD